MRIDKFIAHSISATPQDPSVRINAYYAASGYDIYQVSGTVVICRDGCAAVHLPQGVCYIIGEAGKKYAAELAKKYPKPNAPQS